LAAGIDCVVFITNDPSKLLRWEASAMGVFTLVHRGGVSVGRRFPIAGG
jgi:hypothetical protein